MTGFDIYNRCLALMGYNISESSVSNQILIDKFPHILNQVASDLKIHNIKCLSENIETSPAKAEALYYGAAMLLSLTEGETDKNQVFTEIYNSKRAAALSQKECIEDVLPTTGAEGI